MIFIALKMGEAGRSSAHLTPAGAAWATEHIDPEAQAWAAEFGKSDEERGDYWLDPRDALDIVEAYIVDGLSCPNSDKI